MGSIESLIMTFVLRCKRKMRAAGRGRRRKISSLRLYVSLWSALFLRNQKQGKFTMRRRGEEKQSEKTKKRISPFSSSLRLFVVCLVFAQPEARQVHNET